MPRPRGDRAQRKPHFARETRVATNEPFQKEKRPVGTFFFLEQVTRACFSFGKPPPSQLQIARQILLKTIINRFLYAKFPLGVRLSCIIHFQKDKRPVGTFVFLEQVKGGIVCTLPRASKPIILPVFRGFWGVFA